MRYAIIGISLFVGACVSSVEEAKTEQTIQQLEKDGLRHIEPGEQCPNADEMRQFNYNAGTCFIREDVIIFKRATEDSTRITTVPCPPIECVLQHISASDK